MRQRGNKYSTKEVARAKELFEAGWTPTQTARLLDREFGRAPHPTTIRKWTDPDYYEAVKIRERVGGISGPNRYKTWKLRLERMRELRQIGLSCADVARVISHDFSVSLNAGQAERILAGEMSQRSIEALLWPQGSEDRSRIGRPRFRNCNQQEAAEAALRGVAR